MSTININNKYSVYIEKNILQKIPPILKSNYYNSKIFLFTDDVVYDIYGKELIEKIKSQNLTIGYKVYPQGESIKSLDSVKIAYDAMIDFNMSRNDIIIALGGGVVGDFAGFMASTFMRGIRYISIPTTLLSQVDSSVGGKTAINHPQGKNLIGTFYNPENVYIDVDTLSTLKDTQISDAMAEIIKYSLIMDKNLYNFLSNINSYQELMSNIEHIITTCLQIKAKIVTEDEKESGIRRILNYGHTIGHALESITYYQKYTHGQAVAIGMCEISKIFEEKGRCKEGTYQKIVSICKKYHLPTKLLPEYAHQIPHYIKNDKKISSDIIHLVNVPSIGKSEVIDCPIWIFDIFKKMY